MASELLENLKPFVSGETRAGRLGRVVAASYVVLSILSVVWAVSGGSVPDNALGADVQWTEDDAYPTLVISNESDNEWTGAHVLLDNQYYYLLGDVSAGEVEAISTLQLTDGHIVPRPDQMYHYEMLSPRPAVPERAVDANYRPREIVLQADQGSVVTPIAPAP